MTLLDLTDALKAVFLIVGYIAAGCLAVGMILAIAAFGYCIWWGNHQ